MQTVGTENETSGNIADVAPEAASSPAPWALRFTLRDLFVSVTMITLGIAGIRCAFLIPEYMPKELGAGPLALLCFLGSTALLGGGIFAIFQRVWLGFALGFLLPLFLLFFGVVLG